MSVGAIRCFRVIRVRVFDGRAMSTVDLEGHDDVVKTYAIRSIPGAR